MISTRTDRTGTGRAVAGGLAAALALAPGAGGGEPPCPGEGDCFVDNGTPGCEDEACCAVVCAADPFCCDTAWDGVCAAAALELCEVACPGEGGCFVANGSAGCDDEACCEIVCAVDPACCDVAWDQHCAWQAATLCLGCGSNDSADCGEPSGSPACTSLNCCAVVCAADPFCCDVAWDEICVEGALSSCCPGDVLPNGVVDVDDLVAVILAWGPCPGFPVPCPADLDGNRVVDVDDLVEGVILSWGPCGPPVAP